MGIYFTLAHTHTLSLSLSNAQLTLLKNMAKSAQTVTFPEIIDMAGQCKKRGDGKSEILNAFKACDPANTGEMETDLLK